MNCASLTTKPEGSGFSLPPPPEPQAPWSAQTSEAPGRSFCVHHFADQLCPSYEAEPPPVYTAEASQAGAQVAAEAVAAGRMTSVATTAAIAVSRLMTRLIT